MTKTKKGKLHSIQPQSENETEMVNSDQNATTLANANPFSSSKKAPKRKKIKKTTTEESIEQANNDVVDGDTNLNVMPTPPPSKRQKKRQKKEQNSIQSKDKEVEKTISYLSKWDTARAEWKYEKLRQIHIQKNIFEESIISNEYSDTAIRYLSTSKGHARTIIIEAAKKVIKEIEENITDKNQEELTGTCQYERARIILQSMQEE